jgi:S1-C subfamily serine protease
MQTRHALLIALVLLGDTATLWAKKASTTQAVQPRQLSLLRVNVTGQGYDYFRPWQKRAPFSKRALGAVLSQGRVLVTADLVANQNYVELERAESGEKIAASVEVVDYEANLALLQPQDKKFLDGLAPLELATDTIVGDRVAALQLEQTGALVVTDGLVTAVQVMRYPVEVGEFLTYRLSIALQYRDNSYTVPLVKNNKLAGLLLRYDPRSQLMDAIPAPIIAHFLKDAAKPKYEGFPTVGFDYFPTRDPQLRKYAGETGNGGGVYVRGIEPGSAVEKAGLQEGDILTAVGNFDVDQNGNYVDPLYKKLDFTNLLTTRAFAGDKVPLKIHRQGKPMQIDVTMEHRAADESSFTLLAHERSIFMPGGLIFQERPTEYLRNGDNWLKEAPQRFVLSGPFSWELFPKESPPRRVRSCERNDWLKASDTHGNKVNGKDIHSL